MHLLNHLASIGFFICLAIAFAAGFFAGKWNS